VNHKQHRNAVALWVAALFICMALAAALRPAPVGYEPTIGIANHNPGNIRAARWQAWQGAVGVDPWGHLVFKAPFWGLRAIRVNLEAYRRRGLRTPREISKRWAEPGPGATARARHEDYIKKFCKRAGYDQNQLLDLHDMSVLQNLAQALVWAENGLDPYTAQDYAKAFPARKP
jgi:hypothetical protein